MCSHGAAACLGACPGECEPTFAVTKVTEDVRACLSSHPHGRSGSCRCCFDLALPLHLRRKVVFPQDCMFPQNPHMQTVSKRWAGTALCRLLSLPIFCSKSTTAAFFRACWLSEDRQRALHPAFLQHKSTFQASSFLLG